MSTDPHSLDLASRFEVLKEQTPEVVKELLQVEGRTRQMRAKRVWVEDMDPDQAVDKQRLKQTKLTEGTWKIPVYADLELVEKSTGKVLSESKRVRVADLPRPTPHQSMLVRGTEYHPHSQFRLKPGVYVRERQTGEISAQFNFAKTREARMGFELGMDPDAGVFVVRIAQAKVGLYPVLRAVGVPDALIERAWGSQLLEANQRKYSGKERAEVAKLYKILTGEKLEDDAQAGKAILDYLGSAKLDADTTRMTLGASYPNASPESLLAASRKMVMVNRGQAKADDRDELRFKQLMTYDEHVVERMRKARGAIQGKLRYRIENKDTPGEAVLRADLNRPIEQHFTGMTGLSSSPEQVNPVGLVAENMRVVSTGEGGIRDLNVVTEAARNVHPSQAGFVDPVPTSQSKAAGVSLNLALGAKKVGSDPATEVWDFKAKKAVLARPADLIDAVIAFPDQYQWKGGRPHPKSMKITAIRNNETVTVNSHEVTHAFTSPKAFFGIGTNLTPMVESASGNRVLMAANQFEQYVPLAEPEAPLVQSRLVGDQTTEQVLGGMFSAKSPVAGTVVSVSKERICVKPSSGKQVCVSLYDNYPLNQGFIDSRPVVQKGDKVTKGQLLADTNHTKGGVLAPGRNLRTAYLSMRGYGFEDAIVVSEVAADKLTSEHIHKFRTDLDDQSVISKSKFDAAFPAAMTNAQRAKLDADGIIRKGQKVSKGDTLIAHMRLEEATPEDLQMGRIYRKLAQPWRDRSQRWESDYDGVVIDVVKQPSSVAVHVKTQERLKVGDKLVGRSGNKGVVAAILPEGEMPVGESGPLEVLMNPLGVPSRLNPSQIHETARGKAAEKLGKTMVVDDFEAPEDNVKITRKVLAEAGLDSDKETVIDPRTGSPLGQKVAVGVQHVLKLEHQADHKFSARSRGSYDTNLQPTRGGARGSSAVSQLETNALMAHGAKNLLQEMSTHKGEKNDDFWRAVATGQPTPPPKVPFVFDKFLSFIKGSGVNVEQQGSTLQVVPMTDADVEKLSAGEVRKAEFLRAKDLSEIKHGLFDEKVFGGVVGKRWGHVELAEPVLNPSTRRAAASLLGMTQKDLNQLSQGDRSIEVGGRQVTGGAAIKHLLSQVNVDSELAEAREKAKKSKANKLDEWNRKIRYLQALKEKGVRPEDSYVLTKVPVIPPVYRPVYPLASGELRPAGVNLLLADVINVNNGLKELNALSGIPDHLKKESRQELQRTVEAAFGFSEPLPTTKNRAGGTANLRGLAADVFGPRPKEGFFQSRVWRKQQDLSGRAVVIPDPTLGMDEIGIPEDMAWEVYQPFVQRELVSTGTKALEARNEMEQRTPKARAALERAMQDRPVTFTRAPSLHKFSFLAGKPKLVDGKAIRTPPLIVTGLNLDHDGDTMSVHVPVSKAAVNDALKMLPSNNLIQPSTGKAIMVPSMEGILGLALLTEVKGTSKETFPNLAKAEAAYRAGRIRPNVTVTIGSERTTIGRALVKRVLGSRYDGGELNKKKIYAIAEQIAKKEPKEYPEIFRQLVDLSNEESYLSGFTVGLDDLDVPRTARDAFFQEGVSKLRGAHTPQKIYQSFGGRANELNERMMTELASKSPDNAFFQMARSGAKGGASQLRQILYSPVQVDGPDGGPVPVPIKNSYAEGLSLSDYWTTTYGARKGVMDRSLQVQVPGVFAKRAIAATMGIVVTESDCGTLLGVREPVGDPDIIDRYMAAPAGGIKRNTLITPQVVAELRRKKVTEVMVRSQLRCESNTGVCQKCYGLTEKGAPPSIGANIGVENAQYATEPATQAQMRTFHTGGAAGSGPSLQEGFPAVEALTNMPKLIKGQATLARRGGTVKSVTPAPAGGWHVLIGEDRHYVPQQNRVTKKKGDVVKKGDSLSTGLVHPRELSELTDAPTAQERMVSDLREQYGNMGKPINKRVIETLVRGLTNYVQITDPGDHESWQPGDHVPLPHAMKFNQQNKKSVDFKPAFKGLSQAPLVQEDWIARLGATYLKTGFEDSVAKHLTTDVGGDHPLPAMTYGQLFGEG